MAQQTDGPILDLDPDENKDKKSDKKSDQKTDKKGDHSRTSLGDNLADKAARIAHRTTLGGYGEIEYHNEEGADSFFMAHRYVLFIYSQISERISTATEFEIEFGGSPLKKDGVQQAGEAILEFSVIDFKIAEWMVLRGGIILVPFGVFNLRHDAPTRDLTERPTPLTTITPTTWFEAGAGVLGTIPLGDTMTLSYEFYAINGLDAKITRQLGMKGAVGSKLEDNNDDKAFVGRISFSPILGLEFGVSGYTGEYDDHSNRVNMVGADLTLRVGWFELLGEYVRAFIDEGYVTGFTEGSPANTRNAIPTAMQGWYVQMNFHFTIPGLWDLLPDDMADATFTAVIRYEDTDTDLDVDEDFDVQKLTFGLNFRPVEAYVWKHELQLVTRSSGGERQDMFSGDFSPSLKYVSSLAFLF